MITKIKLAKIAQLPRLILTLTLFSVLAACGGGGGAATTTTTTPPITSTDAGLSKLVLSAGSLSPTFDSKVTDYTVSTTAETTTVTPTISDANAKVAVNNITIDSGSASAPINLNVGDNIITLIVTAADKSTQTYKITVKRIDLATDASLQSLTLSSGTLNRTFASDVTAYTLSTTAETITLTPTVSQANAKVTVNGITTDSGSASAPIALTVGDNIIPLIVTATDGTTTETYNITVIRIAKSLTDASLSNIELSAGSLKPAFASNVIDYTIDTKASSITVTPAVTQANATVTVNGITTDSASASAPIELIEGENTITLIVTAEDGETKKTYRITVKRIALSADVRLSSLALSAAGNLTPAFAGNIINYEYTTKDSTTTVTAVVRDTNATVTLNNDKPINSGSVSAPIELSEGENTITLKVTAEDGTTTSIYTVKVTRYNTNLSALSLQPQYEGGTPPSQPVALTDGVFEYGPIFIDVNATSVKVNPTAKATSAGISITATAADGTTKNPLIGATFALNQGETIIISVTVTVDDGTAQGLKGTPYKITVTRPSGDGFLSSLKLTEKLTDDKSREKNVALKLIDTTDARQYEITVGIDATHVTLTPVAIDSDSVINVFKGTQQIPVASGTKSPEFTLTADGVTILMRVKTNDNVVLADYSIKVIVTNNDATLKGLSVYSDFSTEHKFTPGFTAGPPLSTYKTTVKDHGAVGIYPKINNSGATIEVKRIPSKKEDKEDEESVLKPSNSPSVEYIGYLDADVMTRFEITVTSQDLSTDLTYIVEITQEMTEGFGKVGLTSLTIREGTSATLGELATLDPDFKDNRATNGATKNSGVVQQFDPATFGHVDYTLNTSSSTVTITAKVSRTYTLQNSSGDKTTYDLDHFGYFVGDSTKAIDSGKSTTVSNLENGDKIIIRASVSGTGWDFTELTTITVQGIGTPASDPIDSDQSDAKQSRANTLELLDPNTNPAADHKFGENILQLGNGNIVVHVPADATQGANSGAVHLYSPFSATPIHSHYGKAQDQLGSGGVIALDNHNFVIVSPQADTADANNVGSVMLVNGNTGKIINTTITGDKDNDQLGSHGISRVNDNTFAIISPFVDQADNVDAGSVTLVNDTAEIIQTLYGNDGNDDSRAPITQLGNKGVTALGNGNFVIVSSDNSDPKVNQVQWVVDQAGDGSHYQAKSLQNSDTSDISLLNNHNFLIGTRLVNGQSGEYIGTAPTSSEATTTSITPLGNSNYVILERPANNATETSGSIRLYSGVSGEEIKVAATQTGTPLLEDTAGDFASTATGDIKAKITVLGNHNFLVTTPLSDHTVEGKLIENAGTIRLINGNSGQQIATRTGERANDKLGSHHLIELQDGKYALASSAVNTRSAANAGSVIVFDQQGKLIGKPYYGNDANDQLGSHGLTALGNNKFVIATADDDVDNIENAGSIQVINAADNTVDNVIAGNKDDQLGKHGVTAVNQHNFVFTRTKGSGSVHIVDGTNAKISAPIIGDNGGDMDQAQIIKPVTTGNYFILSQPMADKNGNKNAGKIRTVIPEYSTTP